MKATAGTRCYDFNYLLTGDHELYAHENGIFVLYSHDKNRNVAIDPIGMTRDEVERAVMACDTMLARAEPAPVNRHERRAASRLN